MIVRPGVGLYLFTLSVLAGCASFPTKGGSAEFGDNLYCPNLVHYVRPLYPKEARRKRIQGIVSLRAVIAKTGEIGDVRVLKGDPVLIPPALRAVKQWRYAPYIFNSEPVEMVTTLEISFDLNQ